MKNYCHQSIFALLAFTAAVATAEFAPLEDSPQSFDKIELGLVCPSNAGDELINQIAWTVEPVTDSNITTISTQPANLVNVTVEDGVLKFTYNSVSLTRYENEGTGVKMQVPAGQISEILTKGSAFTAQVLSGFTSLKQITSNADAVALQFAWDNDSNSSNSTTTSTPVNFAGSGSATSVTLLGNVGTFELSGSAHSIQIQGNLQRGEISANAVAVKLVDGSVQEQLIVSGTGTVITTNDCSQVSTPGIANVCNEEVGLTLDLPDSWSETSTQSRICGELVDLVDLGIPDLNLPSDIDLPDVPDDIDIPGVPDNVDIPNVPDDVDIPDLSASPPRNMSYFLWVVYLFTAATGLSLLIH